MVILVVLPLEDAVALLDKAAVVDDEEEEEVEELEDGRTPVRFVVAAPAAVADALKPNKAADK